MRMNMDYSQTSEAGDFSPAPAGVYRLKISEVEDGETRAGDPKAAVKAKISAGPYKGKKVLHTVTFMAPDAKGAGFAKHWLRVINQPFEGKVTVDTDKWEGREFIARLSVVKSNPDKNGKVWDNNVIEDCWNLKDEDAPEMGATPVDNQTSPKYDDGAEEHPANEEAEIPF